ncbi:synaptophysin-like [Euwallacea fornicatus]|uniref:synaptophysin-like n=1 Tax=Euwallacea fornicatus TaxID=995702 RepID=UPI00338E32C7
MDAVRDLNFSVFQEPRGVMRILHFVFSICAFATITGYTGIIRFVCSTKEVSTKFEYPFYVVETLTLTPNCTATVSNDFSSDARFFVATGVLSFLYAIAIIYIYLKMDEAYKINKKLPLYDFLITVFLAVLWLSSSAAWSHALSGLKTVTSYPIITPSDCCKTVRTSSFSTLNISAIFGFLNFFLWAADLWFLFKETEWFQGGAPPTTSGV